MLSVDTSVSCDAMRQIVPIRLCLVLLQHEARNPSKVVNGLASCHCFFFVHVKRGRRLRVSTEETEIIAL